MPRRIVITGMGWVTPLGCGVDAAWTALLEGRCAAAPVTRFNARTWATNFAAEVKGFRLDDHLTPTEAQRRGSLAAQFALAAASHAVRQAGLDRRPAEPRRLGIYMGSGEGIPDTHPFFDTNLAAWREELRRVDTAAWARASTAFDVHRECQQEANMTLWQLARTFRCRGPSFNCMTACAAGTQAIGEACQIIRRGDADAMLSGGAHSMIHPLGMTGFIRLTAMSTRRESPATAARPFDRTRDGFVMGEGAGVLVLESLEHAKARGAEPLAEIVGYGSSADAFRITDIQPQGHGAQAAMSQALRQAGITPSEPGHDGRPGIHYISAHGTGTEENDKIETAAVKAVFGSLAPRVPFSSVKSMMGHLIQAAGAVELITCVQAIRTGWIPPTMNLREPDPSCDLDYVPNAARDLRPLGGVHACLSNSFGFGGQNNTIVVRRFIP